MRRDLEGQEAEVDGSPRCHPECTQGGQGHDDTDETLQDPPPHTPIRRPNRAPIPLCDTSWVDFFAHGSADTAEMVCAAALGESAAWDALVDRYARLVWSVARAFGLSDADAADVSQTTWLRLAEHLPRLREPERVGAWLSTTARREAMRARARTRRDLPLDDVDVAQRGSDVDQQLLDGERAAALWKAFASIPPPCQALLRLLLAEYSYAEISEALDMPIGSIGPTRGRCLERLRVRVVAGNAQKETVVNTTGAA